MDIKANVTGAIDLLSIGGLAEEEEDDDNDDGDDEDDEDILSLQKEKRGADK